MKKVKVSELIEGKVYADCSLEEIATNMKFIKKEGQMLRFEYVDGKKSYGDGIIELIITPHMNFYDMEEVEESTPSIELSPESLATITTALRRYFDDYPIVKGSKEDDVINAIDELIEKFDMKQLEPLRDEMKNDLGFESNQESTTDPNEDRENDVEWNNRPNQYI